MILALNEKITINKSCNINKYWAKELNNANVDVTVNKSIIIDILFYYEKIYISK